MVETLSPPSSETLLGSFEGSEVGLLWSGRVAEFHNIDSLPVVSLDGGEFLLCRVLIFDSTSSAPLDSEWGLWPSGEGSPLVVHGWAQPIPFGMDRDCGAVVLSEPRKVGGVVFGPEAAAAILGRVCPEVEWVAATVEHRRLIRVGSLLGRIHTDTLALTLYEGCVSESRDVVDGLSSRVSEARTELASLLGFSSRQVDWLVSLTSDGWYPEDLAATRRFCDLVDVVLGSD